MPRGAKPGKRRGGRAKGTSNKATEKRREIAACRRGHRSVLLAIVSVLEQLERLREGKTDEPFTDFEQLLEGMFRIGADGLERIAGEPLLTSHP